MWWIAVVHQCYKAILMNTKMSALLVKSLSYLTKLSNRLGASWLQWTTPSLLFLGLSIQKFM